MTFFESYLEWTWSEERVVKTGVERGLACQEARGNSCGSGSFPGMNWIAGRHLPLQQGLYSGFHIDMGRNFVCLWR